MHPTPRQFRALLVASVLVALLGLLIDSLLPSFVPESVRNAELEAMPSELTLAVIAGGVIGVLSILLAIGALVGLFLFRRWGRILGVAAPLVALATYPILGFVINSGFAAISYEISSMLWGAVLAIAYFSSLSGLFERNA
jgi:hypothetical protein